MFRFIISVWFFSPLMVLANELPALVSSSWGDHSRPVLVQKVELGTADYRHQIKRFRFATSLTRYLSLSAQVITRRQGLRDCANSFKQSTLGYEVLPRLRVAEGIVLGVGYAYLDGGDMAFITGNRVDMADSQSLVLSTELLEGQPDAHLEVRMTRTRYDAHEPYDQPRAFIDNRLHLAYQLRF